MCYAADITSSCLVNKASAFDSDASRASSALYELDSWTRIRGRACVLYTRARTRRAHVRVGRKVHATARQLQSPYDVWNTGAVRRDMTMSVVWYSRRTLAGWSDSEAERGTRRGTKEERWRDRERKRERERARERRTSKQRSKERVLQGTQESLRFPNRQVTAWLDCLTWLPSAGGLSARRRTIIRRELPACAYLPALSRPRSVHARFWEFTPRVHK